VRKAVGDARSLPNPADPCGVRRPFAILALTACALIAGAPASAPAQTPVSGGTDPGPATTDAVAGGSAPTGRVTVPAPGGANGGNSYGRPFQIPPVLRNFTASPRSVTWGGGVPTTLRFRIVSVNAKRVRVRLTAHRAGVGTVSVNLGRRATNRAIVVRWTRARIDPGTYTLSLTAVDSQGHVLARAARAGLTVRPKPAPPVAPAPTPAPSGDGGVFPVAGPHSWNDGFGVDRGDHIHQGQDLPAADGTPLVAARASVVFATGYSASGAGEYVVLWDADADRSYVYFHLHRGSTAVAEGQSVRAGQQLGAVGSTGDATGAHLHFELWVGRWFDGGHAIDPAPTLRSWER
jgi:murein DD-endopeptidase MepM/ murein hydrolase activator NlpD